MNHKDLYGFLLKAMFCTYTHSLTYIHILSEIPDMQLCHVLLHCSITVSALEAKVEIRHTIDSGVFMMVRNLKHLEYLKYHNPDTTLPASKRASVDCADGPINTYRYQTIPYTYFDQEYISPSIKLFHLYEQRDERKFLHGI